MSCLMNIVHCMCLQVQCTNVQHTQCAVYTNLTTVCVNCTLHIVHNVHNVHSRAMGGTYAGLCSSGTLLHCAHLAEYSSPLNVKSSPLYSFFFFSSLIQLNSQYQNTSKPDCATSILHCYICNLYPICLCDVNTI